MGFEALQGEVSIVIKIYYFRWVDIVCMLMPASIDTFSECLTFTNQLQFGKDILWTINLYLFTQEDISNHPSPLACLLKQYVNCNGSTL